MPRDSRNSRELWRERQALHRAIAAVQNALARLDRSLALAPVQPMPPIQRHGKQAFKPPLNGAALEAWRDARRSGHPPRIDSDPEIKTFILATLPAPPMPPRSKPWPPPSRPNVASR